MKRKFRFNKVAIIGVGLIGGSIGMALKKRRLAREVVGLCHRRITMVKAKRLKAIDKGTLNLKAAVRDADLIILATPVNSIITLTPLILKHVNKDCILTDVGSSKSAIINAIQPHLPDSIKFIATHPLAGSEKKGVEFASGDLFNNSICIFTPTKSTNKKAMKSLSALWKDMGAKIKVLSPSKHDNVLSFVSHLPHVLAFNLINSVPKQFLEYASGGLRDSTRIAASDALIWRDICLTNSTQILNAIKVFESNLSKLKRSIKKHDLPTILKTFDNAKIKKETLSQKK